MEEELIYNNMELEEEPEIDSDAYEFHLKDFDGPLDTLLYLIRKSKMSIENVRISEITEQYLVYMAEIETVDLERASEFITMAAWLIEIKSKSLLPKLPQETDPGEIDDETLLKQQLTEYKMYKEASLKMKDIETEDILYRAPDISVGQPRFVIKDMTMEGLKAALTKMFAKLEQKAAEIKERHIVMDRFTVAEMTDIIKARLSVVKAVSFFDLFESDYSRSEIITTFQAILELMKLQEIKVMQRELFDDIIINKV